MKIVFLPSTSGVPKALVLGYVEKFASSRRLTQLNRKSGGDLKRAILRTGFTGIKGEFVETVFSAGGLTVRLLLIGLGPHHLLNHRAFEEAGDAIVGKLSQWREASATVEIELPQASSIASPEAMAHLAFGATLASYRFNKYRTRRATEFKATLEELRLRTQSHASAKRLFYPLSALASGISLAKDLVNEPPNVLYPREFARRIKALLSRSGVRVEIFGEDALRRQGFGALLAVGQGSARESQLLVMRWNGGKKTARPLALVGKGVCFDSGGLSLKTGPGLMSMVGMKGDMAGGAAVTGAMLTLAECNAAVNVVAVVGLVENMPAGDAMRPDDVVKSLSGQTIEVLNTDAEGRLVLADVLTYSQRRFAPEIVIDVATLTASICSTLGTEYAGLFSNDAVLCRQIEDAGAASGESVWRLPLGPHYDRFLESTIADVKNIGGTNAGAITAAQFLLRFIDEGRKWAHLDIAGVAWRDGDRNTNTHSTATGWGVRLLYKFISSEYGAQRRPDRIRSSRRTASPRSADLAANKMRHSNIENRRI